MSIKLTPKQEALLANISQELRRETALAYIDNGYENKTQAYIEACKRIGRNPSKNPATSASEILNYPNVIEFINSIKESVAEATATNAEYVLRRLRQIDELDVLDIVKDDLSGFKPLSSWPKEWRISINALDMKKMITRLGDDVDMETIVEKVKWPDKVKNLEMIGRHVSVNAFSGDGGLSDEPIGKIKIEVVGANGNG